MAVRRAVHRHPIHQRRTAERALDRHRLFVYTLVVVRMGHFSAIAGVVALGIIVIPVTVRTAEDMLRLIPQSMRHGSAALGAQPWRTITSIVYPAAAAGC
jgi:phosphate transport system permease protein